MSKIDYSKMPILDNDEIRQVIRCIKDDSELCRKHVNQYPEYKDYWLRQEKRNEKLVLKINSYHDFWNGEE